MVKINYPVIKPHFNQLLSDEDIKRQIKSTAMCVLFYNTDLRRLTNAIPK